MKRGDNWREIRWELMSGLYLTIRYKRNTKHVEEEMASY
jgi:hypothetical protein